MSDLRETFVRTAVTPLSDEHRADVTARIDELKRQADDWFDSEGVAQANRSIDIVLDARYVGQNFELAIGLGSADPLPGADAIKQRFFAEHERAYGFHNPADRIEIVNFRLIAVGKLRQPAARRAEARKDGKAEAASHRQVWFSAEAAQDTPVYDRAALMPGDTISGPAVIEQLDSTTLLFPGDRASGRSAPQSHCRDFRMSIDPITLEIMSNGFKSIADETYIALMKSAYSTNIKERHDHSTAIIDPAGRLIVQAENSLAIHLGSMMGLMNTLLAKMPLSDVREGDIFISNDPVRGRRLASARREHGDAGVRRRQARLLHVQHRASRRHRRHHAGQHGGRHRDLSGRHAHSGDPPVPRGRTAERHPRPAAAQCARAGRAARRLFRAGRGVPARRAARLRDDRGTRRADADRGIRRDHPPHARAAAGRARPHPARRIRLRRRDGRRRRRHHQHSDQAARHRAAARQQQKGAVRLHRHRAAGEGQHQLHRHGHACGRALFAQGAARSGRAEQPGPDRDRRYRRAARHAHQFADSPPRSRRAPTRRSGSWTW